MLGPHLFCLVPSSALNVHLLGLLNDCDMAGGVVGGLRSLWADQAAQTPPRGTSYNEPPLR